MTLIPWLQRSALTSRRDRPVDLFESLLDTAFRDFPEAFRTAGGPPVNVSEDEKSFTVSLEMPGMKQEDFDVQVLGDQLIVSGERKFEEKEEGKEFHRVEMRYGKFSRAIPLSEGLDIEHAEAVYDKGILTVTIPKVEPKKPSKIQVKTS